MKKAVTVQVNVRLPKGRVKTLRGDAIRFCKSVEGLIGMIVGDYTEYNAEYRKELASRIPKKHMGRKVTK